MTKNFIVNKMVNLNMLKLENKYLKSFIQFAIQDWEYDYKKELTDELIDCGLSKRATKSLIKWLWDNTSLFWKEKKVKEEVFKELLSKKERKDLTKTRANKATKNTNAVNTQATPKKGIVRPLTSTEKAIKSTHGAVDKQ